MNRKSAVVAAIVGLTIVAAVVLRTSNRADASISDCYSSEAGPSKPTICN